MNNKSDEHKYGKIINLPHHQSNKRKHMPMTVTYFVPNEKKSGGAYVTKTGVVSKLREYERQRGFEDGTEIPVEEIFSLDIVGLGKQLSQKGISLTRNT